MNSPMHKTMRVKVRTARQRYAFRLALALLLWLLPLLSQVEPMPAQAAGPKTVIGWGHNFAGQSDVPVGLSEVKGIAAGTFHSLALLPDGTVVGWGHNGYGKIDIPAGLSGVIAVSAGWDHSLALKGDGTVVVWGDNQHGQLNVPVGLSGVIAIDAGHWHNVALKSDGTVVAWGESQQGIIDVPAGLSGVKSIGAGSTVSLALKNDGTVVAWGGNTVGQTDVPPGLSGVTAIAVGGAHSLALKNDGTVVAWGNNSFGQIDVPPGLSNVTAIAAGLTDSVALKSDGTIVVWGAPPDAEVTPVDTTPPAGLSGVTAMSSGGGFILVIADDTFAPKSQPSQAPAATTYGWNNTDVTVNWNWVDRGLGVDPAPGRCTGSNTSSGEGTLTLQASCSDLVGNEGSASHTVKVDKTAPTIFSIMIQDANEKGWNKGDVTVFFTCSDGLSGVASCASERTLRGDGKDQTVSGTVTDLAGNSTSVTSPLINIDKTAPTIESTITPAANASGWHNSDVSVAFICSDSTSGVDTCATGQTLSSEGAGQTVSGTATDNAGNSNSTTSSPIHIDKTLPTVAVTGVSDGASYAHGSVPSAACNTQDALSGVATAASASVSGGNADGTGSFTATCSGATDKAGNSAAAVSVSYNVESTGVVVGLCGPYEVRQVGGSYSAAGWSGSIKVGTNGNNTLNGTSGRDLILGLGGNDKIDGKGGDDVLCGGDGVDLLTGGAGNDYLDGGKGNDVLNGGTGDHDVLIGGDGNDVLLDGDGVLDSQGGAGSDLFTMALRNGWRNPQGQATFSGLTAGYGNDAVGLAVLGSTRLLLEISGDERDDPASSQEGNRDTLVLVGRFEAASRIIKFEQGLTIRADASESDDALSFEGFAVDPTTLTDASGSEFLSEPVGDEEPTESEQRIDSQQIFLPSVRP